MKFRRAHMVRDKSGSSAVEFAIVMPIFLLIVFGVIAYGLYFGASHSASQLAADAARASIAGLSDAERASLAQKSVMNNADNYPLLQAKNISVQAGPSPSDNTEFKVTVTYNAADLPIWNFAKIIPLPSKNIVRVAIIKRGGY